MANNKNDGYRQVPADYAIDGLVLEAERRGRVLGRPYSYGQLVADTTREEREGVAEDYRRRLTAAIRQGRYRVSTRRSSLAPPQSDKYAAEQVKKRRKLEMDDARAEE